MGKKKNKNNHNHGHEHDHGKEVEKKEETQKKEGGEGGGGGGDKKKEENKNPNNVVLKIEMHCEGCSSRIVKIARSFEGVESVKAEAESNKLTVTGKVDPIQIRDTLHLKTKKKVELISPQPKKQDSNNTKDDNNHNNKPNNNTKPDNADNKKPKEPPVTTAVIKVAFHCQGCIDKIQKIVYKAKGVQEISLDKQKETVTVKGTMDVKALTEALKERLKRPAEIVPPKKEKDGEKDGGGGGGDKKKKGGGGAAGGGEGQDGGGDMGAKVEGNRMEYMMQPGFGYGPGPGYGYVSQPFYGNGYMGQPVPMPVYGNGYNMGMAPPVVPVYDYGYGYGHGHVQGYPAHMKFNDENPNSCSVM